jgi:UDPglucose--hexose-1-phosphate uridylyltransferase
MQSEIRKDYFLDKYVIITPGRALRPRDLAEETVLKRNQACQFCAESLVGVKILDSVSDDEKNKTISIANIYPALSLDNEKAYGVQEVIIESPEHERDLADFSEKEIERVLRMYASRTEKIGTNKRIEYILCFKNQGSKAGASIVHAHSQVFATELLPPSIKAELKAASEYQTSKGTCPYCDIIKREAKTERLIFEDGQVVAIAPYASEYHYEAWIFAKRHSDNIARLNDEEFLSFAQAYKLILGKLQTLGLSFNCFLHQAVSDETQHFYMKIQPRDSVWAGVELGSGLVINSVLPEEAAAFYKS